MMDTLFERGGRNGLKILGSSGSRWAAPSVKVNVAAREDWDLSLDEAEAMAKAVLAFVATERGKEPAQR